VSQYQKGKTNLDFLELETVSASDIRWAICKYAPCPRQIIMPACHHSVFLQAGCPSCCPTNSVKGLKVTIFIGFLKRSPWQFDAIVVKNPAPRNN